MWQHLDSVDSIAGPWNMLQYPYSIMMIKNINDDDGNDRNNTDNRNDTDDELSIYLSNIL